MKFIDGEPGKPKVEGEGLWDVGAAIAAKKGKPLATLTVANGFHTPRTFIVCVLKTFDFGLFLSCVCLINDDNEHHYIALVIL